MLKDELKQFYGTEYYNQIAPTKVLATDGIIYFAEKAEAFWLITDIAINGTMHDKLRDEEFLAIKTRNKDTGGVVVQYEDGNYNVLLIEEYPKSTLPDNGEFTIWMEGNVMLLPSEH